MKVLSYEVQKQCFESRKGNIVENRLLMMKQKDPFIESLQLTVKTREAIAREYNVTPKTLIRRLKNKGVVLPPGTLFPKSIKLIYYTLDCPGCLKEDNYSND